MNQDLKKKGNVVILIPTIEDVYWAAKTQYEQKKISKKSFLIVKKKYDEEMKDMKSTRIQSVAS